MIYRRPTLPSTILVQLSWYPPLLVGRGLRRQIGGKRLPTSAQLSPLPLFSFHSLDWKRGIEWMCGIAFYFPLIQKQTDIGHFNILKLTWCHWGSTFSGVNNGFKVITWHNKDPSSYSAVFWCTAPSMSRKPFYFYDLHLKKFIGPFPKEIFLRVIYTLKQLSAGD